MPGFSKITETGAGYCVDDAFAFAAVDYRSASVSVATVEADWGGRGSSLLGEAS